MRTPSDATPRVPKDRRAQKAAYRASHRAAIYAYRVAYDAAHRDELAAHNAAYRASHRAEAAAYTAAHKEKRAAWWAAHREEQAAYRAAHREEYAAHTHARHARLRGVPSERVLLRVLFDRDRGICGICGKRVYWNARDKMMRPSHDHVLPVSHGGANTYANSRLAHRRCNVARGNRGAAQLRMETTLE